MYVENFLLTELRIEFLNVFNGVRVRLKICLYIWLNTFGWIHFRALGFFIFVLFESSLFPNVFVLPWCHIEHSWLLFLVVPLIFAIIAYPLLSHKQLQLWFRCAAQILLAIWRIILRFKRNFIARSCCKSKIKFVNCATKLINTIILHRSYIKKLKNTFKMKKKLKKTSRYT